MSPTLAAVPGALLERIVRLLRAVENNREGYCPICDREGLMVAAHYDDCELAAVLAELEQR
jgi:hypothetical protein